MQSLLREAGIDAAVESVQVLGIGSAGLGVRGMRDEDGTHARVRLEDATSVDYREYATTTGSSNHYMAKEMGVFRALKKADVPAPDILAWVEESPWAGGDAAAVLLSDPAGNPLEEIFTDVSGRPRATLWSAVGATLRRLHDVDPSSAAFLEHPGYQRPWTRFVPYFFKSLRGVRVVRPDLGPALDDLAGLRRPLAAYLDARPRAICFTGGYYPLPGMMLERLGAGWRCASWLSLGYYVSIADPARDVVAVALAHREWTGEDVPASFYRAYGSRPDPLCEVLYETKLQVGRGAAYQRTDGRSNRRPPPPPHSRAIRAVDELPQTVERLRALLG